MAFSTCGDFSASVHHLVKNRMRLKANTDKEYLMAGEARKLAAIQTRETGRLRKRLSLVTKDAPAYGTLRFMGRQQQHLRER